MEISSTLGIVIMMNNYFHDVATALLISSAFAIFVLVRVEESMDQPLATLYFLRAFPKLVLLFRISLVWIILGGIPRAIFYTSFEWANAAGKGQVPALVVKHIVITVLVVWGFCAWRLLRKKVAAMEASLPVDLKEQI